MKDEDSENWDTLHLYTYIRTINRALSVKNFLLVYFIGKTKLHGGASLFHPQIDVHSNSCLPCALCAPCYRFTSHKPAPPLLICFTTQQTDWQYSYYAKNIKGCLSSETIYIEHNTLVGRRFSTVFKILT